MYRKGAGRQESSVPLFTALTGRVWPGYTFISS